VILEVRRGWIRGLGLAVCLLALAGCVPDVPLLQPGSAPAPAATVMSSVLATPTIVATPVPTDAPSATPAPTVVPSATPVSGTLPVRLVIPGLKLDVPVSEMAWGLVKAADGTTQSEWLIPEKAGGHAVNTAALGQPGNVVISGHNNIFGRVFLAISQAWPPRAFSKIDNYTDSSDVLKGQAIEVYGADGKRYAYTVTDFYRVKDSGAVPQDQRLANARFIGPTDHAQLTLTTCWPPWSNTYRLIVIAEPNPLAPLP
jgi:sortase A